MSRHPRPVPPPPKLGSNGALVPQRGFSRVHTSKLPAGQSAWRSHDGLLAVSSRGDAHLPGSGDPPLVGPQWLVSVSAAGRRPTPAEAAHTAACFAMPAFDEDNHHPGIARHLWCPIDPQYQQACECKLSEVTVTDGDYAWTTEADHCRGCDYERMFDRPCPIHGPAGVAFQA